MPDFVISTGLDGRPSIWPVGAISRDKHGVFRDFNNRVVKPPAVAMDAAQTVGSVDWFKHASEHEIAALVKQRCKPAKAAADRQVEDDQTLLVAQLLLPTALRIMREEDKVAQARDDAQAEQEVLCDPNAIDSEDEPIENRAANWYARARDYWQRVSTRTRQRSQFAGVTGRIASPIAVKTMGAVAADTKRAEDPVAANARKAKQFSMYSRF